MKVTILIPTFDDLTSIGPTLQQSGVLTRDDAPRSSNVKRAVFRHLEPYRVSGSHVRIDGTATLFFLIISYFYLISIAESIIHFFISNLRGATFGAVLRSLGTTFGAVLTKHQRL